MAAQIAASPLEWLGGSRGIEMVSSDFGGEELFDFFHLEVTGEAVLIGKTDRRNAISNYISVENTSTSERAFFATK